MERSSFSDYFVVYRYRFLLFAMVMLAFASAGLSSLKVNPELKAYVDPQNPYLKSLDAFENKYSSTDQAFILLKLGTTSITSPEGLAIIDRLTHDLERVPFSYRVESLTNFRFIQSHQDELVIDTLDGLKRNGSLVNEQVFAYVNSDPLVKNRLITANGNVAIIGVTFAISGDRNTALSELFSHLKAQRDTWQRELTNIDVHLGGGVIVEAEMAEIIAADNTQLVPLMLLMGFLINVLLLRSLACYLSGLVVIICSVFSTLGVSGFIGFEITNVSSMGFMLVIILATADTVHLSSNYVSNLREGMEKTLALKRSLATNFKAVLLTNVTTIIGFLSLNSAGAPQLAAMGNIGSIGILFALACSFFVFPAVLLIFNVNPPQQPLALTRVSAILTRFAIRHHTSALVVFFILMLVSGFCISKLEPDENRYAYFREGTENRSSQAFYDKNVDAQRQVYVDIRAADDQGIFDPPFVEAVDRLSEWLKQQDGVIYVYSYADLLKKLNKSFNGDDPTFFTLPATKALASQLFFSYEMSMNYGQDLTDFTDTAKSSVRLTLGTRPLNNKDLLLLKAKLERELKRDLVFSNSDITGMDLVFADHSDKSLKGMLGGDGLTMLMVTLVIIVTLRSVRYGLLSLLPNLAAPILMYGVWGAIVGHLSLSAVATFSVCLGIIIDDTLHGLVKYMKSREEGLSIEDAINYALVTSGPAIIVTTLILSAGSAMLAFSDFLPNAEVGLVMAPMTLFALVFEFLVFPGLIIKFEKLFSARNTRTALEPSV